MGSIHVLHVDDDPDFVDLGKAMLEREDDRVRVTTATSADEGLDRLDGDDVDCIVSDYQMPGRNGIEFLEAVREDRPGLPFILFTGKGSEEVASDAISAGVTDYLQKGTGTSQFTVLANRIANSVERHRAVRRMNLSHRAMETASEGISLVEPDGSFSYVNPAFAGLFGYEPDELVGAHWTVLYHDEEARRLDEVILPAVRETGYWSGETVRLTKAGDRLVTDHRLAHTDEDVIVCTARDVTMERIESSDREAAFDLLVDAMDDRAFCTLDHEGYVTRWRDAEGLLGGYRTEEAVGRHVSAFFDDDDLPERLLEAATDDGSVTHRGPLVRKDGSPFSAETTISASYDESGTLRGFAKEIRASSENRIPQ